MRSLGRDNSYLDILGSILLEDGEQVLDELSNGSIGDGRHAAGSGKCLPELGAGSLHSHIFTSMPGLYLDSR